MKKISLLIISFLLIGSLTYAQVEIPAPFAKAKEMCLKVKPDVYGRYLINFEFKEASMVIYVLGYLSQQMVIGIGKAENGPLIVVEYHEQTGKFTVHMQGMRIEIPKDEAIK